MKPVRMPEVRLELARPGPLTGHLLSPLTRYLALCEGIEADTVSVSITHEQLHTKLAALRYEAREADGTTAIPNDLRRGNVRELGQDLAELLGRCRGLQTRIAAVARRTDLTHLRLVVDGSELSQVPFELALVPPGWEAAGQQLLLASATPFTLTRELRSSGRIAVDWSRPPRILVCSAAPRGFAPPPIEAHLTAIQRALLDWAHGATKRTRPLAITDILTYLPDASLDRIEAAVTQHEYTHVHFVCHGAPLGTREEGYGLALAAPGRPDEVAVASGQDLAGALLPHGPAPTMVVVAACDSGNPGNPALGGASLAYHLHKAGAPWVIASQLPLTYGGSTILTRELYAGVLEGLDPRRVLHRVRAVLAKGADQHHDWASVVAYAAIPHDLGEQVRAFRIAQLKRRIESAFERASGLAEAPARVDAEFERVDGLLRTLAAESRRPDHGDDAERSELRGLEAAYTKRKAQVRHQMGASAAEVRPLLEVAAELYRGAASTLLGNHWAAVQLLCLDWVLGHDPRKRYANAAELACEQHWDAGDERDKTWAAGSLMELALLRNEPVHGKTAGEWAEEVVARTRPDDFPRASTRRQVDRYVSWWCDAYRKDDPQMLVRAKAVLAVFDRG